MAPGTLGAGSGRFAAGRPATPLAGANRMAPRAYWTGNVKISLVSFGVRLYNVVSEAEKVRLNQVHKGCNQRIKMPTTCPVHGAVDRSEICKA